MSPFDRIELSPFGVIHFFKRASTFRMQSAHAKTLNSSSAQRTAGETAMPTQSQLKLKTVELNRYPTVKVELQGRFMLPSRTEHECSVIEMSTREIRISAPVAPEIGEKIIIYIAELGRFEGGVVRRSPPVSPSA
jgi:hypothetical protein